MTTIELKNGYYIEINRLNYTLKQYYPTKDNKMSIRTCGHFSKMETACGKYIELIQHNVMDGESLSMQEYVKTIEQVNKIAVQGLEEVLRQYEIPRKA